jgi:DNA-binding NarL/FixJ family response regulator
MLTRLLIADEHPVTREGLRVHLESQPGWSVVAEANNGNDAVLTAIGTKPDVAILAYELPVLNGIEATLQLRAKAPDTEVLIFTRHNDEIVMRWLLYAGARGLVLKSEPISSLVEGVRSVAARKPYFAPAGIQEAVLKVPNAMSTPLTDRERSVVRLIAEGQTTKQIALTLGISPKTAESHRSHVMEKLHLHSTTAIVRYAVRNRLTEA